MADDEVWLVPPDRDALTGNQEIVGLDAKVEDFWRFALGDLRMNNARGYLAEFIVARALGLNDVRRTEWDAYDILWGNVTIEVKSSAYLQLWDQRRVSSIQFSGLKGTQWHPRHGDDPAGRRYNAAVYVFCVHTAKEHEDYDQLRLDQWAFYVIPRSAIAKLDQKGIGLARVITLAGGATPWAELKSAITTAAEGQELPADKGWWLST